MALLGEGIAIYSRSAMLPRAHSPVSLIGPCSRPHKPS